MNNFTWVVKCEGFHEWFVPYSIKLFVIVEMMLSLYYCVCCKKRLKRSRGIEMHVQLLKVRKCTELQIIPPVNNHSISERKTKNSGSFPCVYSERWYVKQLHLQIYAKRLLKYSCSIFCGPLKSPFRIMGTNYPKIRVFRDLPES